jgi:hypothetical protein
MGILIAYNIVITNNGNAGNIDHKPFCKCIINIDYYKWACCTR